MHFQLRTDNHIENDQQLSDRVRAEVEAVLQPRFGEQLRRVEVYLQDMNSHKGGVDKRCSIEAHLAGMHPIAVHDEAAHLEQAITNAVDKLARVLEKSVERIADRRGGGSTSGQPT